MSDVYVVFRAQLPFTTRLNGTNWEVSAQRGTKTGYIAVIAASHNRAGKFYVLTSGKIRDVDDDLKRGFLVRGGTPERGLVTALRRTGHVILFRERLPSSNRLG